MQRTLQSMFLAVLVCLSLVVPFPPRLSLAAAQPQSTKTNASQAADQTGDPGWPRGYSLPNEAQMVIYQPQIASWDQQKHLVAMAAVSYIEKDAKKPALGTVKL